MELQGIQKKDTNGRENYEELHNVRSKEIDPSYACSTSTQSYLEIASSSSSIVLPSSSFKSLWLINYLLSSYLVSFHVVMY